MSTFTQAAMPLSNELRLCAGGCGRRCKARKCRTCYRRAQEQVQFLPPKLTRVGSGTFTFWLDSSEFVMPSEAG